jgi:hypothetical protein
VRTRAAARFFDRNPAYDGYTGAFLFNCSFTNFDDVAGDGSTNRRRALAVDPDVVGPARGCVLLGAQRWVMGDPTDDMFEGALIRHTYNVKRVTDKLTILTPAQACLAQAGTDAYVNKLYFKAQLNSISDSDYDNFWNVFFARSEPVTKGLFLRDEGGTHFRVRDTYRVPEGFLIVQCDELDADASASATFETGGIDPITDKPVAGSVATTVLQFDPMKLYRFEQQAESQIKPGDRIVVAAASALTPKVGMRFAMGGRNWQTVLVKPEQDAYALLVRLA